jgi:hypothetical protein
MKLGFIIGTTLVASMSAAVDAGVLGYAAFARTASNGNVVIDVFTVVSNASDRLLYVYNVNLTTTQGGSTLATFVQQAGTATRGWKPDATTSTRSNIVDSFMTIGVDGGAAYEGQYYASAGTGADGSFTNWSSLAPTVPANAGWFLSPPTLPDNVAESMSGMTGTRTNTGTAGTSNLGIWSAHLVMAPGSTNCWWAGSSQVKDGVTGATVTTTAQSTNLLSTDSDGDGIPNSTDSCPSVFGTCINGCPPNSCGTCGPVDNDGDGVTNCQDNCPAVANPTQVDCNGNGVGDACENFSDCNYTGLPDSCDIAAGTSIDADTNGVPDECQLDCNMNQISDLQEIFSGSVSDRNVDRIPDTCQGAVYVTSDSGNLGPPSGFDVRTFTIPAALHADSNVTVTIDARGDLNGTTEFVNVALNGEPEQRFFQTTGNSCPSTPDRGTITLSRQQYAALLAAGNGSLTVTVTCPITVDPTECKGNGLTQIKVSYLGINPATGDCNHNNRLDIYEIYEGLVPDCNHNNVPDSCDTGRGGFADCDLDGTIDICQIAASPTLDCNSNGIIDTCELATRGTNIDCDQNGRIDSCQVADVPGTDCDGNLRPDACDLADGGATIDCDQNGRIDSCQVTETPGTDCNGNLRPDACDVAAGTSADIDANGKPDECQTVTVPGQYAGIQAAIDTAPANEMRIIAVAAGTYAGPIAFNGKPVIVRGTSAATTVIEGNGNQTVSVVRFTGGEPVIAALERFTVRGGTSGTPIPSSPTALAGGGIFGIDSAASVRDCVVEQNAGGFGGGMYFLRCSGQVRSTTIRNNSASSDGGGFQANQGTQRISDVTIENNTCNARGGGVHLVQGNPTLMHVIVRNNYSNGLVGGVSWYALGSPTATASLDLCEVTGNSALIAQGGVGISAPSTGTPSISLRSTNVCDNTPRPNVSGAWSNLGNNTICDCVGDLTLDGAVNGADLGILLGSWFECQGGCASDLNSDGIVNGADLGLLLSAWGPCAP